MRSYRARLQAGKHFGCACGLAITICPVKAPSACNDVQHRMHRRQMHNMCHKTAKFLDFFIGLMSQQTALLSHAALEGRSLEGHSFSCTWLRHAY